MGDVSENFSRFEWTCKCGCGFKTVDGALVNKILERVRKHFGNKPVHITPNGGCRCKVWNEKKGGSEHSYHMLGWAADIWIQGVSPRAIYDYLCNTFPDQYGFGLYLSSGFVHIDCREGKARWIVN